MHSSPLLLFRKPEFFHTFSVIWQHKNFLCCRITFYVIITENVWKTSNFLKSDKGLLCTQHLIVYIFFKVWKEKVTNFHIISFFNKKTLNSDTNFWSPCHLVLITLQHAHTTVEGYLVPVTFWAKIKREHWCSS